MGQVMMAMLLVVVVIIVRLDPGGWGDMSPLNIYNGGGGGNSNVSPNNCRPPKDVILSTHYFECTCNSVLI